MKTNNRTVILLAVLSMNVAFFGCAHKTYVSPVTTTTPDKQYPEMSTQPYASDQTQSEMMKNKSMNMMDSEQMKDMRHACMQAGDTQMKCDQKMMDTCSKDMSRMDCKKMMKQSRAGDGAMGTTK